MFSLPPLLAYIIRSCSRRPRLFPDMWRRKHNRRRAVPAACPLVSSFLSWASCRSLRSSLRPSARLACLLHMLSLRFSSAHHFIRSPFPRRFASSSSAHRFALCLVSPRSPHGRQAKRGGTIGGRSPVGGRMAAGVGRMAAAACLPRVDGRSGSIVSLIVSFPLIGPSNQQAPWSFHLSSSHLINGEELSFPFRPTSSRLLFSACLLWLVPPSPAGGCEGFGMACGGGREACLLVFSCPVPFSRCRSFARCYTIRVDRAARSYLGRCGAFYGLFCPLSCRRWLFSKHTLKWHPVASGGHFRRWCPLPFLGSPRRLVLANLPCSPSSFDCGVMASVRACLCCELWKTARGVLS